MKCEKHPEKEAIATCSECGRGVCKNCKIELIGENFCQECADRIFSENEQIITEQKQELDMRESHRSEEVIKFAEGRDGLLELLEDRIRIRRRGLNDRWNVISFFNHGFGKDKEIMIEDISSIEFRKSGFPRAGYILFYYKGGFSSRNSNIFGQDIFGKNEDNRITFSDHQEAAFEEIKFMIEEKMREFRNVNIQSNNNSLSDLEKLAELKDKGIINDEEFEAKKKQILGL